MKLLQRIVGVLSFTVALAGCGGSSSGAASTPAAAPAVASFPIAAAFTNYFAQSHSYNLTGMNSAGQAISQTLTFIPGSGDFEGAPASTFSSAAIIQGGPTLTYSNTVTRYFSPGYGRYVGFINTRSGAYGDVTSGGTYPQNAQIGQSGSYDTDAYYVDYTKSARVGDGAANWQLSVVAGSSTNASFCLTYSSTPVLTGITTKTEVDCYTIDTSGNLTNPTITEYANGMTAFMVQ